MKSFLGGETEYVKDWVTDGSVVFDIGAHIGAFTCWALDRGATVYAFEPFGGSYQKLKKATIEYQRCSCFRMALGPRMGQCSLRLTDSEPSSAYVIDGTDVMMVDWATLTKDMKVIDVLKVDIEGMEYAALSDADLSNVRHFVIETHDWTPDGQPAREGVGHRDSSPRRPHAYEELIESLSFHHDITVYGDSTGGHVVGHLR